MSLKKLLNFTLQINSTSLFANKRLQGAYTLQPFFMGIRKV